MPENIVWRKLRLAVLDYLGPRCASPNCRHLNEDGTMGCDDLLILQVDHTQGDGCEDRRGKSPHQLYKLILEMPSGEARKKYQVLCPNCNFLKKRLNKEYRKESSAYPWNRTAINTIAQMRSEEAQNTPVPAALQSLLEQAKKLREVK